MKYMYHIVAPVFAMQKTGGNATGRVKCVQRRCDRKGPSKRENAKEFRGKLRTKFSGHDTPKCVSRQAHQHIARDNGGFSSCFLAESECVSEQVSKARKHTWVSGQDAVVRVALIPLDMLNKWQSRMRLRKKEAWIFRNDSPKCIAMRTKRTNGRGRQNTKAPSFQRRFENFKSLHCISERGQHDASGKQGRAIRFASRQPGEREDEKRPSQNSSHLLCFLRTL